MVTFNIIHPKEIFGNEVKVPFKSLRRGPFMATDTSKIDERKLTGTEKEKLKDLEKKISKKDFTDRYGKEGEAIYYATLTKMAKKEDVDMEFYRLDEKIQGLVNKSKETGVPYSILKKSYDRGMAAWKTGHRPGTTPQQWAMARVNSMLTGGKADPDLQPKARAAKKKKKAAKKSEEFSSVQEWFESNETRASYQLRHGDDWWWKLNEVHDKMLEKTGECCDDCSEELDEMKSKSYALVIKGKVVAKGSKADMMKLKKQKGGELYLSPGTKIGDMVEEVELDEAKSSTGYELYHNSFANAMSHAYTMAKKIHRVDIDRNEIDDKVATGPRKPSVGKTNKYRLKGKGGVMQIQVYNSGNKIKPYELNMYKEGVELDESLARRDAKRAMARDKDMRARGDDADISATQKDVEKAANHIIMQLRKSVSMRGQKDVEFASGKEKVSPQIAQKALDMYNKKKTSADKSKFQMKIAKSYRDLLQGLKESINEQPEHEITVGDYTTKFFYMCGSAQKVMKANANVEGAEELTRMQDDFYELEKEAMDAGEASEEQKKQAVDLYNKIMKKAGEIGLADDIDDYMKMHIDSMIKGKPELGFGRTDVKESLWANIHKKRQRIKRGSGERMRKKGDKGAPTPAQMQRAKGENTLLKFNQMELKNVWGEVTEAAEYQGRKVQLNNPTKGDVKKFKVYVKNDKGNVVKVEFGDPNMEIKRDDPARRKSFRARHNCDNPGPKYKARFWSCKFWEKGKSVTDLMKG
jgi:hypothetical protein